MKIKMVFAALLAHAWFAAGHAQTLDQAKLDQFFDRLAVQNKAMGSLTIAKDGEVIYSRAIGYSRIDATAKTPLTTDSRFRIASITKMFTAVMILQLADEGKLKLTDTLDRFAPQVPNAGQITLEQILRHRSGIPNVRREQNSAGNVHTTPITKDEILALIGKAAPAFAPDSKFQYSNSGYFLLGLIVEKVTGKSYADALEEMINSKIGLKDTYTATGSIDVNRRESLTYIHTGSEWKQVPETHPSILFGAGQIVSTTNDLARFIRALFEGKLVSPETLHRMITLRDGWGLGIEPHTFADKTFLGHAGGGDNYGSWLSYLPEEKLAVAYMTNAKVYPVPDLMRAVVDIIYHRPFEIPTFETLAIGTDVLEQYVGVYSSADAPVKFTITRQGSTLFVQPGNQSSAALEATAQDKFQLLGGRVVLEFDAAKQQMILKRGGPERIFTKEN